MGLRFERIRDLPNQPVQLLERLTSRRNARLLLRLLLIFASLIVLYSIIFHYIAASEGYEFSWMTGFYWTMTTMTTLGLGDIALESELGRMFTILVLVSGVLFLLVIIPFTFVQLFQSSARVPRELSAGTSGHVILTHYDPVSTALINKLISSQYPYVIVVADLSQAAYLRDHGLKAVVGELDDAETYRQLRVGGAALVASTASDVTNTAISYAVRQASQAIPIVATSTAPEARHILHTAGCSHVISLDELMGQSLARRTIAGDAMAHIIGQFDRFAIAEATTAGTPLIDRTLADTNLRELVGVTVVGVWERGKFQLAGPDTRVTRSTVLVLAGTEEQIDRYNELFCIYNVTSAPLIIIGGGNVGQAMGRALDQRKLDYRIIERSAERVMGNEKAVVGEATDRLVLERAGIATAPAIAITTHDDEMNIYLTTLCRHLNPEIQIISRATLERSVSTLHAAGCDFVMSYASMGANIIFNLLKRGDILMLAEGVDVFKVRVPSSLAGKTISETSIRKDTGCTVIGIAENSKLIVNPDPTTMLPRESQIILLGSVEAESNFLTLYGRDLTS